MENRKANRKSAKWTVLAVVLLLCFALLVGYSDVLFQKEEPEPADDGAAVPPALPTE